MTTTPCDKAEQPYTADADTASPYPWRPGQLGATPQPAPKPVRPDQTFWMVYYYGRTGPAPRHWKYAEALEEADRLAREDTDRLVYILRAEQYALVREVPIG